MTNLCRHVFCRPPAWALLQICKYQKVYSTRSSQAVPHSSTIPARRCLTSVIRREPVYSSWYGRRQQFLKCPSIYKKIRRENLFKLGIVFLVLFTKYMNESHLRNFHPISKNPSLSYECYILMYLQFPWSLNKNNTDRYISVWGKINLSSESIKMKKIKLKNVLLHFHFA